MVGLKGAIFYIIMVGIQLSCIAQPNGTDFVFDLSKSSEFTTIVGGNIAHSGEKMGIWASDRFTPLKSLGISSLRTHDTRSLDWDVMFPNWDADPYDENSYDFEKSDRIVSFIYNNNFKLFLRLGVSASAVKMRRTIGLNPPDPKKWAIIVSQIIKHYTQRWASGFEYKIEYIEIWNEPDLKFWGGTKEGFYKLCQESITKIKNDFPTLKVGVCGIANIQKASYFIDGLLKSLADPNHDGKFNDRIQFDFLSWHVYELEKGVGIFKRFALISRNLLNKNGYNSVSSFCTEWNASLPSPYLKTFPAAVDITSTLIWAEYNDVDGLYFYPLIDKWGIYNIDKAMTSTSVGVFRKTNLSNSFKIYHDFKQATPLKILGINKNSNDKLQIIGAKSKDSKLFQILIASKSYNVPLKLMITSLSFKNAKVQVFNQTQSGVMPVANYEKKARPDGKLELFIEISVNSIILIKINKSN